MERITYYCGTQVLKNVFGLDNKHFAAIGGERSKHNSYDGYNRMVGHPTEGPDAIMPVTRHIEFKRNPSLHKCDARCQNATGFLCECSCRGKNHGAN